MGEGPRQGRGCAPPHSISRRRAGRRNACSRARVSQDLRHQSRAVVDGPDRAPARSYLYSIGLTKDDLEKPIVGVANTWIGTMPCNFHLRRLSAKVMEGIRAAGGTPLEYNTIAISDGITMGT